MNTKKKVILVILFFLLFTVSGCSAGKDKNNTGDTTNSTYENELEDKNTQSVKDEQSDNHETESSQSIVDEQEAPDKAISETEQETTQKDDAELEKTLEAYRKERETMTNVKMGNGLSGFGAPNAEDYGIDDSGTKYLSAFDSREKGEAFEVAEKYVTETLGIKTETETTVYMCVDPKIYKIYEDEDKGVANGYANDNIFICEYCDNGIWQYLILVRDSKEDPWTVIYHGNSYKE